MEKEIVVFKALSDRHRILIIDMLSCGELCACEITEKLGLTQPTVSHHMSILHRAGLINSRKEGKWVRYSLNTDSFKNLLSFIERISSDKENCICKKL
ncbi:MAG: ArsR/SmtB family transcription factor [Peptococcaceae bacterium]